MTYSSLKSQALKKMPPDQLSQLNKKTFKTNKPLKRGTFGNKHLKQVSGTADLQTARRQGQNLYIDPKKNVFRELGTASGLNFIATAASVLAGTDDYTRNLLLKQSANEDNIQVSPVSNAWG